MPDRPPVPPRAPRHRQDFGDEVLTSIAELLGDFADFVGGPAHSPILMPLLFVLTKLDETTVRQKAVDCERQPSPPIQPSARLPAAGVASCNPTPVQRSSLAPAGVDAHTSHLCALALVPPACSHSDQQAREEHGA